MRMCELTSMQVERVVRSGALPDFRKEGRSMLEINAIRGVLPHRYPFLLVDRVLTLEPGQRIVAIKNVTINEPYFQGHYPYTPIVPGVLIMETMAQVGGLVLQAPGMEITGLPLLTGIDKARFRRLVVPGDQMRIEVTVLRKGQKLSKVKAEATVENEIAAQADLMFGFAPESAAGV